MNHVKLSEYKDSEPPEESNYLLLSSLSSQPPPLEGDNSIEDADYILEENIAEIETGAGEHPTIKTPITSGVPKVPSTDPLFVLKDLSFGLFSFGSLLLGLKPPAVTLVEGFWLVEGWLDYLVCCFCCLCCLA